MNHGSFPKHDPTAMIYSHRDNQKHKHTSHNGRIRYCNHWFNVYKCPVCGRTASHKPRPIICRGGEFKHWSDK